MHWIDDLTQDLRHGVRALVHNPGFSGATIGVLAFGIGLAVAMFTIANTVLLRPLPVHEQDRVVVLWGAAEGSVRHLPLTAGHFERFRREARALGEVAGTISEGAWPQTTRDGHRVLLLNVGPVTGNFFRVLGSRPVLGRTLRPDDDAIGAAPVAVISYGIWRRLFAHDPGVLGRRLALHERDTTYTIVGVAPAGLEFPTGTDVWVPLAPFEPGEAVPIGRLAAGATRAQAAAELQASFRRERSRGWRGLSAVATPLSLLIVGDTRPALLLLCAAAALLWLIACVNASNLLLVRAAGRTQEIAVRRALGAGRARILRQLFTESALLAVVGGVLGGVLAAVLMRALVAMAPPDLARLEEIRLQGASLALAAGVAAGAVLMCGLLPALWTSGQLAAPLAAGDRTRTDTGATRRTYSALVVFQIGLALLVLTAAGLLTRTVRELGRLDTGFAADHLTVLQLAWPREKFGSPERVSALYDRLIPAIEALPGVVAAALLNMAPFTGATAGWDGRFVARGSASADRGPVLNMAVVGSGYFRSLDLPVLRGRGFTDADREGSPRVAVVSQQVARRFWPGQDPVGKQIGFDPPIDANWWTVVGLVPETRYRALREPAPTVYLPYRQFSETITMITTVAVRSTGDPSAATPSIRRVVRETDKDVVVTSAAPMEALMAGELAQPRLSAVLAGVFGGGALVLASVGLYAVLAFVVRQRTRELAIRHALGATASRLRALVLRQALVLAGTGAVWGLLVALAGARLLRSVLFGVSPTDPLTLATVTATLIAVALAAAYIPARRATRADAAAMLREN
jgi:putative ABC transport system permease protein